MPYFVPTEHEGREKKTAQYRRSEYSEVREFGSCLWLKNGLVVSGTRDSGLFVAPVVGAPGFTATLFAYWP